MTVVIGRHCDLISIYSRGAFDPEGNSGLRKYKREDTRPSHEGRVSQIQLEMKRIRRKD